jgi:hypothetical protein
MNGDVEMQDGDAVQEEEMQYGHGALTEEEMNEKYSMRTVPSFLSTIGLGGIANHHTKVSQSTSQCP